MVAVNRSTRCRFLSRTRTVILAVTNDCNMACSYCYQDSRLIPRGGKARLLPAEVARAALSDIVRTTSSRRVGVIFHGGEPTLAPQEWYREVIAPVSRLAARSGKSLQFHMQSNGQLIDDSWASCFRALAINVGISTDGPAEVSLPYRAGSENAARAVRVMQAYGLRPGAIVVATPRNLPVIGDVMSYLADLQLDGFHLLPWLAFGRSHDASDAAYRQMLLAGYIQVAETLLANPGYPVEARLALYVSRFVGKPTSSIKATGCQSLRKPCGRQLIYLDETGGIYPCQSLHSDALEFGRATANGIRSCTRPVLPEASPMAERHRIRCALCAAGRICTYGCAADDGSEAGQWRCELAQGLYEYFLANTSRAARLHDILSESRNYRRTRVCKDQVA